MERLYIVTRRDLPPGAQAAQCCHALRQFVADWPITEGTWFESSNTLCLLAVPHEDALWDIVRDAEDKGIGYSVFKEPDRGGELTAVALEPKGRRLVRHLPLALSG